MLQNASLPSEAFEVALRPAAIQLHDPEDDTLSIVIESRDAVAVLPPSGKIIAAVGERALVFNSTSGALLSFYQHDANVMSITALGPDIVASLDRASCLCIWRVSTGEQLYARMRRRLTRVGAELCFPSPKLASS